MKGIIIWAHDNCRSTLGFYIELIKLLDVPAKINIVNEVAVSQREKVGFKADELKDTRISLLRNDSKLALEDLNSHQDWYHLFASYQKCNIFKLLIDYAIKYNIQYAIMSEAPCNMEAKPWRRILKFFYINPNTIKRIPVTMLTAQINFPLIASDSLGVARLGASWPLPRK